MHQQFKQEKALKVFEQFKKAMVYNYQVNLRQVLLTNEETKLS